MVQVSGIKRKKKKATWYSWIIHKQMAYIINRSVHQCLVHRYNKSEFYYYNITCGTRNQIANIHWIIEKSKRITEKHLLLLCWLRQSLWVCRSQQTVCGKFFKRWGYQITLPASWEIYMQVKKQQLEPDMEQHTGSKSGKEYIKAVYCHLVYLTYIQGTSWEIQDWLKPRLESRLPGGI